VHLKCLRRWQRMVLVSQPTHPAMQRDDIRHHVCNVCTTEFTCAPPTRHELMQSFTGPEIAALIEEDCIIASGQPFSDELKRQLERMPFHMRELSSYEHWIEGVYLIIGVMEESRTMSWDVDDDETLDLLRSQLDRSLCMTVRGDKVLRLAAAGALEGVERSGMEEALRRLSAPCIIVFEEEGDANCGDDHITAVNLTRPIRPLDPAQVSAAIAEVAAAYPKASPHLVELTHFVGGPCRMHEMMWCIVLGGPSRGWTVVSELSEAIMLATSRALRRSEAQGAISGGQTVQLTGLQARRDLNGEVGVALKFVAATERWLVRLRNGEGCKVKVSNLSGMGGSHGRVYVFWGDARWSRAQLLGEIARGHWGLCRASVADVTVPIDARRAEVDSRLVFAPVTEMTEDFLREMNNARAGAMVVRAEQAQVEAEEDGEGGRSRSESLMSLSDAQDAREAVDAAAAASAGAPASPVQPACASPAAASPNCTT
jgi:hypothetical protein